MKQRINEVEYSREINEAEINEVEYSREISLCIHVFMIIVPSLFAQIKKIRTRLRIKIGSLTKDKKSFFSGSLFLDQFLVYW